MSYSLKISPKEKATGRFKSRVNRKLLNAALAAKKEHGLTQGQIAASMGVDKSILSRILNGKGNLTLKTIGEISWAVGLVPNIEFEKKEVGSQVHLPNHEREISYEGTRNADRRVNIIEYKEFTDRDAKTSSGSQRFKLQATS